MAKKTATKKPVTKKPRRRLKRTARRSLAAVLMITAVVVAAIPVPENQAETGGTTTATTTDISYKAAGSSDEVSNKAGQHGKQDTTGCSNLELADNGALPEGLVNLVKSGDLIQSVKYSEATGQPTLDWQFLYHPGGKTSTLCKYNNMFPGGNVNVGMALYTEYHTVDPEHYEEYFTNPANYITHETAWKTNYASQNQMNNLDNYTAPSVTDMDNARDTTYPDRYVVYSYDDYLDEAYETSAAGKFFLRYAERDYTTQKAAFATHKAALEAWQKADVDKRGERPITPEPLKIMPASDRLGDAQKKEFYLEHNTTINRMVGATQDNRGKNMELVRVYDRRLSKDGKPINKWLYIVRAESLSATEGGGYDLDRNGAETGSGFLVSVDMDNTIVTIGERAFKNATNLTTITVPGAIKVIGDEAFLHSGIQSVTLDNVSTVGNRAFAECHSLTTVNLGPFSGAAAIGAEAFRSSGITKVEFPATIKKIGYGAFSSCSDLKEVAFSKVRESCTLCKYAFFDDTALQTVSFNTARENTVDTIGDYCFAVSMPDSHPMESFQFPNAVIKDIKTSDVGMGDFVLANRQSLSVVTMPGFFQGTVPDGIFYNCIGLHNVIFPDTCTKAKFNSPLFKDVVDEEFFVRGPELDGTAPAKPRESTWRAETWATQNGRANGVPYNYTSKTRGECWEVAIKSEDGTLYRYEANQAGDLLSCVLIDKRDKVDIIIPQKVGQFDIKNIATGCFADEELRGIINSITIQDDSISTIGEGAFQGLEKLKLVRIGNSVTQIQANAFADCPQLENVYFSKGGDSLKPEGIKDTAFATNGAKLTFHGDIKVGYGPFEWAKNKDHVLKTNGTSTVNVCYQSLWDSENGTHLTVMVDRETGDVVLLDYPTMSDLQSSSLKKDEELKDYCANMEQTYYLDYNNNDRVIASRENQTVRELRRKFADAWENAGPTNPYASVEAFDGPWINPNFCENWVNYKTSSTTVTAKENDLYHLFFDPLIAEAASGAPTPYFERNPYNFMDNYEKLNADNNLAGIGVEDYQKVPDRAMRFIDGTEIIIVPAGVTSIDAAAYAKETSPNKENYDAYISSTENDRKLRIRGENNAVPGLFSGQHRKIDSPEEYTKGNDLVKRVVLTDVVSLPDYAFDNCEQLESVELGALKKAGELPFRDCEKMVNLVGSENCPVEKGILYEKSDNGTDSYRLVECLLAKGRTNVISEDQGVKDPFIPNGESTYLNKVTEIAENAFKDCKNIVTLDLSGATGLAEIPIGCFQNCASLSSVELPVSTHKICKDAFSGITPEQDAGPGGNQLRVTIKGREMDIADDAFTPKNNVTLRSYEDSAAERYALRYENQGMRFSPLGSYHVIFYDYDGSQIGATQVLESEGSTKVYAEEPAEAAALRATGHRAGYKFVEWAAYVGENKITLQNEIKQDTIFIAQYESDGTLVGGRFVVEIRDGVTGELLSGRGSALEDGKYYIDADGESKSFADMGFTVPEHPIHAGYEPNKDQPYSNNWTINTKIDQNMTIIALYVPAANGGTTSGNSTNTPTSGNTTSSGTTSGITTSTSSSSTSSSSSSNKSSSSSSSGSSTSTTSTTNSSAAGMYTVFVENGYGSGSYAPGTMVIVTAAQPAAGMRFDKWTTESNGVTLVSVSLPATTFQMPANNVSIKANFVADTTPRATAAPGAGNSGGTGNGTTNDNGNTRVDIEKPGISNRDLATANVNGSTDNFIVKISETDEATRAVAAALTNKYGTLDNILYYAMDITLWDSTGTTQISDTTGLSVDITIPIPDSLVAYGGNNMAGAVVNGDQLESLNENFTTINGVPCIRFRATHFSPYTIYVDTGNLVEGMLDTTPKTGDPIHPKWFLSLGLACLSMILFLKRDKRKPVKVKKA